MHNQDKVYCFFTQKEIVYYYESLEAIEERVDKQLNECSDNIKYLLIKLQLEYRYKNRFQIALATCKKILQIDSKNVDTRLDLIQILFMTNHNLKKIYFHQMLDECLAIDNQYWRTLYVQLCYSYSQKNKIATIYSLQKLYQTFPDNTWIGAYLSQFYSEMPDKKQLALEIVENIEKTQNLDYEILIRLAFVYLKLNQQEKSKQIFKKSILLNPESSSPYNYYSYFSRDFLNKFEKSIKYANKAIQKDPDSQMAYQSLALTYSKMSSFRLSLENYKRFYSFKNKKFQKSNLKEMYTICHRLKYQQQKQYYLKQFLNKYPSDQFGYEKYLSEVAYLDFQSIDLEKQQECQNKLINFSKLDKKYQNNFYISNSFNKIYQ